MSGPWEKFKAKEPEASGPWSKFAKSEPEEDPIQADIAKKSAALNVAKEGASKVPQDLANRRPRNASDLRAMGEAALAGPTQAITFGHGPEIVGRLNSMIKGTPYVGERDQAYRDLNEVKERAPLTFGVTNLSTNLAMPLKGGKTIPGAMLRGGAQAALYNPGADEGVLDPLQLGRRSAQGAMGAVFSGGAKAASDVTTAGGRAYLMKKDMNKPFFSKRLGEEVDDAASQLGERYVSPRARAAREALKNKEIRVRPDILQDAEEPGLMAAMQKRTKAAQKDAAARAGGGVTPRAPAEPGDDLVSLRGDVAERVRRKLESKGAYKQRTAFGNPESLKSAEGKVSAAGALRAERKKVAPELESNFSEQSYALGLMNDVRNRAANPQTMMQQGGDTASKLRDLDYMAGTNMLRLGKDLRAANYLNGGTRGTGIPYIDAPVRYGANALAATSTPAAILQSILPKTVQERMSPAMLRSIVEKAMSGPRYPEEEEQ